jgi:hypothetical protein
MIRRIRLTILLASLALGLIGPGRSWAADPQILTDAVKTLTLPRSGGSTPMNVEFHPLLNRYYATEGGNRARPGYAWDAQGNLLNTRNPIGVDVRSLFYNPNTGNLEVATYNAKNGGAPADSYGVRIMNLNASGFFDGTTTSVLVSAPGLSDEQVMPAYDPARNTLFSRTGNKIHVVSRVTGARVDSVIIDTTGLGPSVLNSYALGYDSCYEVFITLAVNPGRVLVHRRNGTRVGVVRLPDTTAAPGSYGMGYANGQILINAGGSGRPWIGYRIFQLAARSVSTTAGQYALTGFPVIPTNPAVSAVFVPQLGAVDSTVWRLGRWAPAQNAYAAPFYTPTGLNLATIGPRDGYWLATNANRTVSVLGDPIPNSFDAPLANGPAATPGWNMISGHFQAATPVSNVQVRSGGTTNNLTSAANILTDRVLWTWNGTAYASVGAGGSIPAGAAFWIRKVSGAAVSLIVPGITTPPAPQPDPLAAGEDRVVSEGAAWELTLEAWQGERVSNPAVMGVADVDPSRWSPMSYALPPAPPVPSLRLAFEKSEWGELSGEYAADYQPAAETQAWDLVLSGAEGPGELTLAISAAGVPAGTRLTLTDLDRGATWDLDPATPLTLAATGGERRLRVTATAGGTVLPPTAVAREGLSFVYPNPFSRSTGLTFALARSADIEVELYDIVGRRVAGLSRKAAAAGEHVLVWDGRDDGGRAVQSGVYFARWAVGAERGTRRLVKVE